LNPITKGNILVCLLVALLALCLSSVAAQITGDIITNSLYPTDNSSKLTNISEGNSTPTSNNNLYNNNENDVKTNITQVTKNNNITVTEKNNTNNNSYNNNTEY
jgi:hypothetical protein